MSDFFVDPSGLNGVHNVLVRASDAASETLAYTRKHCDLEWDSEGLIMRMMGPHEHAYDSLTFALSTLAKVTDNAATEINKAQREYRRADNESAARVDATYSGAKDAAELRANLSQPRPDLGPKLGQRPAFGDNADPTGRLRYPDFLADVEMWEFNPMQDLLSPAAWIRQLSIWALGADPFEGWATQFSGDWRAYVRCATAFMAIGAAGFDIGGNLISATNDVPTVWRGRAAEAEQEFQLALGVAAASLRDTCDQYAALYLEAAKAVKDLFDVVSGMTTDLIDALIVANAAALAAQTVAGPLAGFVGAAYCLAICVELYQEISKAYSRTEQFLKTIGASVFSIEAELAVKGAAVARPYDHPSARI